MTKRKRRTADVDVVGEAQALFRTAMAKNDFSGATSVLRLLKDITQVDPVSPRARDHGVLVDAMTPDERERLRVLLASVRSLLNEVRERVGDDPRPLAPVLLNPIEPSTTEERSYAAEPQHPNDPDATTAPEATPDPDEMITVNSMRGPMVVRRGDLQEI